ncbi:hypothetical protein [Candidatus Nitrospira bockiana]
MKIAPESVPDTEVDAWIQRVADRGFTMVILDAGTEATLAADSRPGHGVYFQTSMAPVRRNLLGDVVPAAHRHGVKVFASVSLRHLPWVDPTWGWMDRSYDPSSRQIRLSPYLDLFHPAYQEYLTALLGDLADTGVDGAVFRNHSAIGAYDGLGAFGVRGFERDFGVSVVPEQLFVAVPSAADGKATYTPDFWRWLGWKARERLHVLARLGRAMRLRAPALRLALEVHPEAVTDPLVGLIRYGEDLLEAKRTFHIFWLHGDPSPAADSMGVPAAVLDRVQSLLQEPHRIWVTQPGRSTLAGDPVPVAHASRAAGAIGVVHVADPALP